MKLPHHEVANGHDINIAKMDRRQDPYLASVSKGWTSVTSGLFYTPSQALSWARTTAKSQPA